MVENKNEIFMPFMKLVVNAKLVQILNEYQDVTFDNQVCVFFSFDFILGTENKA